MRIGLYFGSFNPIHVGHLIIANCIRREGRLDEVWFVVSPLNPFKSSKNLLHEFDRIDMVREAIKDEPGLKATDIEFSMPNPSYTIDTLTYLSEKYPEKQFHLIMGQDNLTGFKKWKNADEILNRYDIIVYPRQGTPRSDLLDHPSIRIVDAPQLDISATYIRNLIKAEASIRFLVTENVKEIIEGRKYYR